MLYPELTLQKADTASSVPFETDEELAWRATQEVGAFVELYRRYSLPVYRYHMAWTGNEKEAQDLTSRTFLAAFDCITSYRFGGRFVSWIFRLANQIRGYQFCGLENNLPQGLPINFPDSRSRPEGAAHFQSELSNIARAIPALSDDMAEALALRFFAGLGASEIGQIMIKSDTAVKMLVYRGLCDLRVRYFSKLEIQNG